jgi:hypothetical protein
MSKYGENLIRNHMDDLNYKDLVLYDLNDSYSSLGPYYDEYKGFDYGETSCASGYKFEGQMYLHEPKVLKQFGQNISWTPLMYSFATNNTEMIRFLLHRNVELTIEDGTGRSAFEIGGKFQNYIDIETLGKWNDEPFQLFPLDFNIFFQYS